MTEPNDKSTTMVILPPIAPPPLTETKLTPEEMSYLLERYDTNKNGKLSSDEIELIVADYKQKKNITDKELIRILEK